MSWRDCLCFVVISLSLGVGCRVPPANPATVVRPRTLRDVPAERLAYRFNADVASPPIMAEGEDALFPTVQSDFDARRKEDALLRTVVAPDGQRVLALYAASDMPEGAFRIDLYSADGAFLRNMTSPDLACAFLPTVAWSSDGQLIAFAARRSVTPAVPAVAAAPQPIVTPGAPEPDALPPDQTLLPTPTVGPAFAPVPVFDTEQIYVCDRDGFNLRPITEREGLIYFRFAWAPLGGPPALAALACKEDEWQERITEGRLPAGRPRLLLTDGRERLLDDRLTEVAPVWSPDAAKIASAFETEVAIYDAIINPSAGGRVSLQEQLLEASGRYDEANLKAEQATQATPAESDAKQGRPTKKPKAEPTPTPTPVPEPEGTAPLSFNPIIRLAWTQPETLFAQTGFMRVYGQETISNYLRWHTLHLSPQAVLVNSPT